MTNRVFADTSFYVAMLSPRDQAHTAAMAWAAADRRLIVTTGFVLIETANFFLASDQRPAFLRLLALVEADPTVEVIPCSAALYRDGMKWFAERSDKPWSVTDCISMQVMTDWSIVDAVTTDHHFRQAGFNALLLPSGA